MATSAEVSARIAQVRGAYTKAMAEASATGIWTSDAERASLATLTRVGPSIDKWAKLGTDAILVKGAPVNGWSVWISGGNKLGEAMQAASEIVEFTPLAALGDTIKELPANIPKDLKNAGVYVGDAAGGLVAGAAGSFLGKAWWVVLLVAAAAVGVVVFKGKLVR